MIEPESLRDFVRQEFLYDRNSPLGDDDPLFPDVMDSLGVMTVVHFVENAYGVSLADSDLRAENFRSLRTIAALVERRQAAA